MQKLDPIEILSSEKLMSLAIVEAQKSTRTVRPNPKVGCAIQTADGKIYSDHHRFYGEAHAEKRLIDFCNEKAISLKGARMAVTLEPCSHYGKTPPCAKAVIDAGIAEVYVGLEDPFTKVQGRGIRELQSAGIKVDLDTGKKFAPQLEELNEAWLFAHRRGRSRVTLKMATSLDGGWATEKGESQWITSPKARQKGHELRQRVDVLVSSHSTVSRDDPSFTARKEDGTLYTDQPKVMILTQNTQNKSLDDFKVSLHPKGAELIHQVDAEKFLQDLYAQGLYDVMIEAGPSLSQYFIEANCADEIWCLMDTQFLGGQRLSMPTAFNNATLPGAQFEIRSLEQLDERSVFLRLLNRQH